VEGQHWSRQSAKLHGNRTDRLTVHCSTIDKLEEFRLTRGGTCLPFIIAHFRLQMLGRLSANSTLNTKSKTGHLSSPFSFDMCGSFSSNRASKAPYHSPLLNSPGSRTSRRYASHSPTLTTVTYPTTNEVWNYTKVSHPAPQLHSFGNPRMHVCSGCSSAGHAPEF
jgi:hypothetical protein